MNFHIEACPLLVQAECIRCVTNILPANETLKIPEISIIGISSSRSLRSGVC
jgi:hypothetical protein